MVDTPHHALVFMLVSDSIGNQAPVSDIDLSPNIDLLYMICWCTLTLYLCYGFFELEVVRAT